MKARIILCAAIAAALLCAAHQQARAEEVTKETVAQKLQILGDADAAPEQAEQAFKFLYDNRAAAVPLMKGILIKQEAKERTVTLAALLEISNEDNRQMQQTLARQGESIKALTDHGLKPSHYYTAVVLSIALFIVIVDLVRRRLLRIEYSWLWVLTGAAILVLVSTGLLEMISTLISARVPQTLFFAGVVFLTLIALHYSVTISKLTNQLKNLSQELAVLKQEAETKAPASNRGPEKQE